MFPASCLCLTAVQDTRQYLNLCPSHAFPSQEGGSREKVAPWIWSAYGGAPEQQEEESSSSSRSEGTFGLALADSHFLFCDFSWLSFVLSHV